MRDPPRHILLAHVVFKTSVVIACAIGLVYVWMPFTSELAGKVFFSDLVLLAGSMLLLAAHRTVFWRPSRDA
ncbi:MAG TPA: hypothetical protein VFY71_14200 [Planctomycetota bacterium]|nr:hypothetical protein [Planctomycetota bacterium]